MKRNIKDYTILTLKGMGMGAADVVPGVSGGPLSECRNPSGAHSPPH